MNNLPLVSIIIPVYNGSNFLRESINSALAQTYDNIEIIVVNDGSDDNNATEKIALSYGDRIRYYSKENGGVSSALNFGISVMKGEWFSWLSHDDLYYPDKIKKQIDFFIKECQSIENCVLLCGSELIDCDGKTVLKLRETNKKIENNNKELMLSNLKHNRFGGCTFLIPRKAFKDVGGFSEDNRTMSDFDMWYRLLLNGYAFRSINEILVKTRIHRKQVTYTMAKRGALELNTFYTWIIRELALRPKYSDRRTFYRLALYSMERNLMDSAKEAFSFAKKYEKIKLVYSMKRILLTIYAVIYVNVKNFGKGIFARIAVK